MNYWKRKKEKKKILKCLEHKVFASFWTGHWHETRYFGKKIKEKLNKTETLRYCRIVWISHHFLIYGGYSRHYIYGRTCLDGYLTKKLKIFPLSLYPHWGLFNQISSLLVISSEPIGRSESYYAKIWSKNLCIHSAIKFKLSWIFNWQFSKWQISQTRRALYLI